MPRSTGESGADVDLSKIRELEERLDNFRIQVADDMTIRGSAWQGFAHNAYTCDELSETQGGGGPTVHTGACCIGGDCSITTQVFCSLSGGTYQGDDTTCDPNPCPIPPCSGCGFVNPDDGLTYLRKVYTYSIDNTPCDALICNLATFDYYFHGIKHDSVLAEEDYSSPDCVYSSFNETISVGVTCICNTNGLGIDCTCADPCSFGPGNLCYDDWCDEGGGSPHCGSHTGHTGCYSDPDDGFGGWVECGIVTVMITYEDQCLP